VITTARRCSTRRFLLAPGNFVQYLYSIVLHFFAHADAIRKQPTDIQKGESKKNEEEKEEEGEEEEEKEEESEEESVKEEEEDEE
jgi:hypothetical protein